MMYPRLAWTYAVPPVSLLSAGLSSSSRASHSICLVFQSLLSHSQGLWLPTKREHSLVTAGSKAVSLKWRLWQGRHSETWPALHTTRQNLRRAGPLKRKTKNEKQKLRLSFTALLTKLQV